MLAPFLDRDLITTVYRAVGVEPEEEEDEDDDEVAEELDEDIEEDIE